MRCIFACLLVGCTAPNPGLFYQGVGLDLQPEPPDLEPFRPDMTRSQPDMGGYDLGKSPDLAEPSDLAQQVDLKEPADMTQVQLADLQTAPSDLSSPVDLSKPPDLTPPADLLQPSDLSHPNCGKYGQPCCGTTCDTWNVCVSGGCDTCGKYGFPVCTSGLPCQPGYALRSGACVPCGNSNQYCCYNYTTAFYYCNSPLSCFNDTSC